MSIQSKTKSISKSLLFFWSLLVLNSQMSGAAVQSDGHFKFRVDVELATVNVVALDKKGNPLSNLKKEDFQLYEDGKKQEILSFDEITDASRISPIGISPVDETGSSQGKAVLIIFDDASFEPEYYKKSRELAEKFVKKHMQLQDIFAVAANGSSMRVIQNFTSEREKVLFAVTQSADQIDKGGVRTNYLEDMLHSLQNIDYSIARIRGQKSVVIFTEIAYEWASFASGNYSTVYKNTLKSVDRSNIIIYIVDPRGPSQPTESLSERTERLYTMKADVPLGSARGDRVYSPNFLSLALESGGFAINADYDSELDKLDRQISNYYILGFMSSNPKHDGSYRRLEVRTALKGVSLRHKKEYQDQKPADTLTSSSQEKTLLTALASPATATQLPIFFLPAYFYETPQIARVLFEARFSISNTAFKKAGGQMSADLNVMGIAYAEDGSIAARFSETLPLSFDREKESEFRKNDIVYHRFLRLHPGKYRLKLAASDGSNNVGAVERLLEIPALPDKVLAGSSIVLAERISKLPDLIQSLQIQLLEQDDPLVYSGLQVEASANNRLPVDSAIQCFFRVYNLSGPPNAWDLTAKAKLLNGNGEAFALDPILLKKAISPAGRGQGGVLLKLPFHDILPGVYRLVIEIVDANTSDVATLRTDVTYYTK
jgi:VWFA-related protein